MSVAWPWVVVGTEFHTRPIDAVGSDLDEVPCATCENVPVASVLDLSNGVIGMRLLDVWNF